MVVYSEGEQSNNFKANCLSTTDTTNRMAHFVYSRLTRSLVQKQAGQERCEKVLGTMRLQGAEEVTKSDVWALRDLRDSPVDRPNDEFPKSPSRDPGRLCTMTPPSQPSALSQFNPSG